MFRTIFLGAWSGIITAGAVYVSFLVNMPSEPLIEMAEEQRSDVLDYSQPMSVSASLVQKDKLLGFVLAEFVLGLDPKVAEKLPTPVAILLEDSFNAYALGEISRAISAGENIDTEKLKESVIDLVNQQASATLVLRTFVARLNVLTSGQGRTKQSLKTVILQQQ